MKVHVSIGCSRPSDKPPAVGTLGGLVCVYCDRQTRKRILCPTCGRGGCGQCMPDGEKSPCPECADGGFDGEE